MSLSDKLHRFNTFKLSCSYNPPKPATILVEGYAFDASYLGAMWWEYRREFAKYDFFANFICEGEKTTIVLSLNMAPCTLYDIDAAKYMNEATDYIISNVLDDVKIMLDRSAAFFDAGHSSDEVLNLVFPDRQDRLDRKTRDAEERAELKEKRRQRRAERRAAKAARKAKAAARKAEHDAKQNAILAAEATAAATASAVAAAATTATAVTTATTTAAASAPELDLELAEAGPVS